MKALLAILICLNASAFELSSARVPKVIYWRSDSAVRCETKRALAKWDNAVNWYFKLVEWKPSTRKPVSPTVSVACVSAAVMKPLLGFTSGSVCNIAFPVRNDYFAETIVLHELGHAFGLAHVKQPGPIMYPVIFPLQPPDLSDDDVSGIRAAYALSLRK